MPDVRDAGATPTIGSWAREAARTLAAAGLSDAEARQDAAVLGRHVLGWDRATWIVRSQHHVDAMITARLNALVERRARCEPVAYILGEREFYGRDFRVTPAVLIPRPETELLVDVGRALLREAIHAGRPSPHLLDVGTGSGCVAITLALEVPEGRVTATDISAAALEIARENARRHGVSDRITFLEAPLTAGVENTVDVLVSNPPYVALADRDTLQPDVRDHEPPAALFGGPDGLAVIAALLPAARRAIVDGGRLAIEIGAGQSDAVRLRLLENGFAGVEFAEDLAGHPRVVSAEAPRPSV